MEKTLEINVADDYEPSPGEINNFIYLCCKYTIQWAMRTADLQVCTMMAREIKGNKGLTKLCLVTCEYIWDHIAGEPEEFDADKLFDHMKPVLQEWYKNTTPEDRACVD